MDIGLLFVGDVMLGRLVNQFLERAKPDYPWGNTLGVFRTADWKACNLECTISARGVPWSVTPKAFHFRTDARNVAVLGAAGIDIVSLANNHILDFEYEAMADSVRILDAAGIGHAGAGANLLEAAKPVICAVKGVKIGFSAFTDNEPEWEARPESPGIFYLPIDAREVERLGGGDREREEHRHVQSVEDLREDVAAEVVRPEEVLPREPWPGLLPDQAEVQLTRPVRGEVWREDPGEDEREEKGERRDAERPAQVAAKRAPPGPTRPDPRPLRRLHRVLHCG